MTPHEKAVEAAELVRAFAELADCGVPSDVQELLMHGNPTLCVQPNALARALLAYGQSRADEATERAARVAEGPPYKGHYNGREGHNWTRYSEYGRGRHDAATAIRSQK